MPLALFVGMFAGIFAVRPVRAREVEGGAQAIIHVHVINLRSDDGRVGCSIWNSPKGFPNDDNLAVKGQWTPIQDHQARCSFSGLPAGTYAIAILHDENSNGKMDKNMLGIPKEGWGFSNDAPIRLTGPPKFKTASFEYKGGALDLTITAKYW